MLGFNGGLIGKTRTTSTSEAVGVWTLLEQVRAQADSKWPLTTLALPSGYKLFMNFDDSSGGRIPGSTWTLTNIGTPQTYVSTGGVSNTGYFSDTGRTASTNYYRITEDTYLSGQNRTYAIWYKGTQSVPNLVYAPGVPLFGDTRGSVYGGFGINSGKACFIDSLTSYNSTASVNTGSWVHIVFTMSAAREFKIYINGNLDSTSTVSIISGPLQCTDIGAHYNSGAYSSITAPSAIDGVAVYDRVLTQSEVASLYLVGNAIPEGTLDNPFSIPSQAFGKISRIYYYKPSGYTGTPFQAYTDCDTAGGPWVLTWAVTNIDGDGTDWWNGDSSMSGNTGTNHFTSISTLGTTTSATSKANAKNPLFDYCAFRSMMIVENFTGTLGTKRYAVTTNTTFRDLFTNQTGANLVLSVLGSTGSFTAFTTSALYFNAYLTGATGDGGRLIPELPDTSGAQASGGISCRVDGGRGYGWKGNLTRSDASRNYSLDGTTTDHTVWIYLSTSVPVTYLVIGGGGGGGGAYYGGSGGGAGGYRSSVLGELSGGGSPAESQLVAFPGTSYTVTVGTGGGAGAVGNNSVFSTITAIGGGRGTPGTFTGGNGGSGGGGSGPFGGGTGTANQGYNGGPGAGTASGAIAGGGGGAGEVGDTDGVGQGGDGVSSSITGSAIVRAGGGGAGSYIGTGGGLGGDGGGGKGATNTVAAIPGTANTGGGGGGANYTPTQSAAAGGSGVVILRYASTFTISNPGGGLTFSTSTVGSDSVTTFTAGTGAIQLS